ncbi:PREDICTED: uncharacterized protein LOC109179754 [Ipomoea nil]|uniref:uncharacterized protein LOC109179754 n=1 Tax=Ipomoea nil TaxID=35883 RepID=UPI000900DFB9|nr:PREDICTED: uncharacterized protein LOC109179754 [Ipomoea nil]
MGRLHGIRVARGAPPISHLLFADDCFLFLRANSEETQCMKYVLDTYSTASGQCINYEKSMVCFSANVTLTARNAVTHILGVTEGDTAGKYLGLPSLVGRRKTQILGFLKDRILTKVRSWNAKFLSRVGRAVLLKNVIQAMPSYAMMVFLLPEGLCRNIEVLMNEYWWTGTVGNGKCLRWRSWNGLSRPKGVGRLGFRSLREMNLALLGKQAWRLVKNPMYLVAQIYKARYYPNSSYFDAPAGSNSSFIWRGLLEVQNVLREGCRRSISNGIETVIGRHAWLPSIDEPYITTPVCEAVFELCVATLFNEQGTGWNVDRVRNIFYAQDANLILNIPISVRKPQDSWY